MRKTAQICGVGVILMLTSGCAIGLKGSVPFQYTPTLPTGEPLRVHAAIQRVVVDIPPGDSRTTSGVGDISEKLTVKLLEDFRTSQVFEKLSFPQPAEGVDVVLKPLLKRFYWKFKLRGQAFIPLFSLFLDTYEMKGVAELQMDIVRPSGGSVLGSYSKSATKIWLFGIRNMKAGDLGAELGDALRDVMKQIKDAMFTDRALLEKREALAPPASGAVQAPAGSLPTAGEGR